MRRCGLAVAVLTCACTSHPSYRIPTTMALLRTDWRPVTTYLDSAVAAGAAPGAVLGVSVGGNRFIYPAGQMGADEPVRPTPAAVYDLASLTKVIGMTTAAMLAVDERRLGLDDHVQRYVPEFTGAGKEQVTIRMLLAHTSGLPAWRPLFRETRSRAEAFALAEATPLDSLPGGSDVYSDLGAIVLTHAIENVYHERIDSFLERRVFQPLGMTSVQYRPPPVEWDQIAPTELDPWRGRVLRGEVHDENAARMDGVSGHAGLFGSVPDLLTFAEWLLREWNDGTVGRGNARTSHSSAVPSFHRSRVQQFTARQNLVPGSARALGWDTPSPGSSAGRFLSPESFGHTGFTGTSIWIDPQHQLAIVLLSNRVNPTRDNPRWAPVRAGIADRVMTTIFEEPR